MATIEGNQEGRQPEKRPRTASSSPSSHSVTKATGDGAGGGTAEGAHEKPSSKLSSNSGSGGNKKVNIEGLTFTIDPDLMDCPICFEELSPPIFQCFNGHLACASCCSNLENCPFCKCIINALRCLAVEKIMESIKVTCPYASSGCEEVIAYPSLQVHKMMCEYSPCHCPEADCNFEAPMRELCHHFTEQHHGRSICFRYNRVCGVLMDRYAQLRVGQMDGEVLFLVLNRTEPGVGNAVMVACLGPNVMEGEYTYKVKAADQIKMSSIQLESSMSSMRSWKGTLPQNNSFLLIPKDFGASNQLILDVTIYKKVDTESKKTASQKGTTPPSKPSSGPRTKLVNKRRTK